MGMYTLILYIKSFLQSWGCEKKYRYFETSKIPTKSGIIGMIASAMGKDYSDDISELASIRFSTRSDIVGSIWEDYHMIRNTRKCLDVEKLPKNLKKVSIPTYRYYLSNAAFVIGLEHENLQLLLQIEHALCNPQRTLYLGRKSCFPSISFFLSSTFFIQSSIKESKNIFEGITEFVFQNILPTGKNTKLLCHFEDIYGWETYQDQPISFNRNSKQYMSRNVRPEFIQYN